MKKCMKKILMANIAAAIICSVGGGNIGSGGAG